ncbi:ribulose 1,5-bisphosphate carboxylase large subunit [Rhodococcus sp. SJ-2]
MISLPPLPLVGSITGAARTLVEGTVATAVFAATIPARVEVLLDTAESLVARVDGVVTDAAAAVARAAAVIEATTLVIEEAAGTAAHAKQVIESAGASTDVAGELLDTYAPLAKQAAPLASQFLDELSPDEVHAAILMLDQFPELSQRMVGLMPVLATLETVGPELHELLEVAKDVRRAITGMPGFNFLFRRGEDKPQND